MASNAYVGRSRLDRPMLHRVWANINYHGRGPCRDGMCVLLAWQDRMDIAVRSVLEGLLGGRVVVVHCQNGWLRSGAFASLILAICLRVNLEQGLSRFVQLGPPPDFDQAKCLEVLRKME